MTTAADHLRALFAKFPVARHRSNRPKTYPGATAGPDVSRTLPAKGTWQHRFGRAAGRRACYRASPPGHREAGDLHPPTPFLSAGNSAYTYSNVPPWYSYNDIGTFNSSKAILTNYRL